jgi:hypothetical protein
MPPFSVKIVLVCVSRDNVKPPKTQGNAARRAAAAAEYERLAKKGAPPGTR